MTETPLRIAHVIARLNVGGAALHVLQLAHEQRRRGHDVVVVTGNLAFGEESMEYVAEELDVPVQRLPTLQREVSLSADARATWALRRLLRKRRLDVLHTHTSKAGATGRIAVRLAGSARPRCVVHTYHGHVLSGYFDPRRERLFRLMERLLARSADTLIAVSDEVRDDLVSFGVAERSRFSVVQYGFDLPPWRAADDESRARVRHELDVADGTFVVGWAGRMTPIKRPLDLVRTLRALRDRDVDAVLALLGDGPDRGAVEALASELAVGERTRFLGFRKGLREWYPAFDAFLLTSANEGAPVVAIEALAAERPVVATRVGGTPTVVEDGVSGFLAPLGDVDALAGHLETLARDPELRARLGRAGGDDVRARFATARMADDIESIYRRRLAA